MLKLAVIFGGPGGEHEVSVDSGMSVLSGLDKTKYQIYPVYISKNGGWQVLEEFDGSIPVTIFKKMLNSLESESINLLDALVDLRNKGINNIFLCLHGTFGEDGTIQGLLESTGFAYNGSSVAASVSAMDKIISAAIFKDFGLKTPDFIVVEADDSSLSVMALKAEKEIGFPCIVKPVASGSSVGLSKVDRVEDLKAAIDNARLYSSKVIIQQFVAGKEVTCGVLDISEKSQALPPTEIVVQDQIFDYDSKYIPGKAEEITPARITETQLQKVQKAALQCYAVLGCKGVTRTDMILVDDEIFVLEINTLPGLTKNSLIPQEARAAGIEFSKLLDILIG